MTSHRSRATHFAAAFVAVLLALAALSAQTAERTAELSGTVTTAGSPAMPLARVLVTINGETLLSSRTEITDSDGRFVFRALPSGSFTVTATRPPFVTTSYGAKRPGRPGTPVSVAAGQHVSGIDIRLSRGAAVTGIVRDINGDIARGVIVEATPLDVRTGALNPSAVTDDRGVYRIFGLPPGRFVVDANATGIRQPVLTQRTDEEVDAIIARLQSRSVGAPSAPRASAPAANARDESVARPGGFTYAPIYFPGSADPDQADLLSLSEGEERTGVDIRLQLARTVTIEGRVAGPGSDAPAGTQLYLKRLGGRMETTSIFSSTSSSRPDTTGAFRFAGVLPGKYRLTARTFSLASITVAGSAQASGPATMAMSNVFFALADLDVSGDDVTGIDLVLQPGLRVTGRVVFQGDAVQPPRDPTSIRLALTELTGASVSPASGVVRADGTFEIDGVLPGTYTVNASSVPAGWSLRSVDVTGQDVLDVPLEVTSSSVADVIATFSSVHTELSGSLRTAAGQAAPDYFVVVFSTDRAFWQPGSRRVLYARPSTTGQFVFQDLPPGDYLIAALTDLEPADLLDTAFMDDLARAGVAVHLNEGEKKRQDVVIAR